jgi:hypothetical protein
VGRRLGGTEGVGAAVYCEAASVAGEWGTKWARARPPQLASSAGHDRGRPARSAAETAMIVPFLGRLLVDLGLLVDLPHALSSRRSLGGFLVSVLASGAGVRILRGRHVVHSFVLSFDSVLSLRLGIFCVLYQFVLVSRGGTMHLGGSTIHLFLLQPIFPSLGKAKREKERGREELSLMCGVISHCQLLQRSSWLNVAFG